MMKWLDLHYDSQCQCIEQYLLRWRDTDNRLLLMKFSQMYPFLSVSSIQNPFSGKSMFYLYCHSYSMYCSMLYIPLAGLDLCRIHAHWSTSSERRWTLVRMDLFVRSTCSSISTPAILDDERKMVRWSLQASTQNK